MGQQEQQTPSAFVKAAIAAEREQWTGQTAVNTWNREFNAAAEHCGLSVEELLALKGYFEVAGWGWQHLGDRIQCGNGRALWTVDRADLLAQVSGKAPAGLEVAELSGDQAAEAISEFSGLSLAPLYLTEHEQKLARAGFLPNTSRSIARADMRGELLTNQGATK